MTSNSQEQKNLKYVKFDYSGKGSAAPELAATYHEIDEDGWTKRVVSLHKDGKYTYASETEENNDFLPESSIYPLSDLDLENNPISEVSVSEFEKVWQKAVEERSSKG